MMGQTMQMAGTTNLYPMTGKNSVMTLQSFAPVGSPYTGMTTGMNGSQMCMMPTYNPGMYSMPNMPNMPNMLNMQACPGDYSYSSPSTNMYWGGMNMGGMSYYPMYSQPMQNGMNTFVPCSTMPEESGN